MAEPVGQHDQGAVGGAFRPPSVAAYQFARRRYADGAELESRWKVAGWTGACPKSRHQRGAAGRETNSCRMSQQASRSRPGFRRGPPEPPSAISSSPATSPSANRRHEQQPLRRIVDQAARQPGGDLADVGRARLVEADALGPRRHRTPGRVRPGPPRQPSSARVMSGMAYRGERPGRPAALRDRRSGCRYAISPG